MFWVFGKMSGTDWRHCLHSPHPFSCSLFFSPAGIFSLCGLFMEMPAMQAKAAFARAGVWLPYMHAVRFCCHHYCCHCACTDPWAILLAMITMVKSIHQFHFLSYNQCVMHILAQWREMMMKSSPGSCVLKVSVIECQSAPLINTWSIFDWHLDWHTMDTWPTTSWSTVG